MECLQAVQSVSQALVVLAVRVHRAHGLLVLHVRFAAGNASPWEHKMPPNTPQQIRRLVVARKLLPDISQAKISFTVPNSSRMLCKYVVQARIRNRGER